MRESLALSIARRILNALMSPVDTARENPSLA